MLIYNLLKSGLLLKSALKVRKSEKLQEDFKMKQRQYATQISIPKPDFHSQLPVSSYVPNDGYVQQNLYPVFGTNSVNYTTYSHNSQPLYYATNSANY